MSALKLFAVTLLYCYIVISFICPYDIAISSKNQEKEAP